MLFRSIIGFSEILSREMFGPIGQKQYLEYSHDILASGTHLLSLINDILDLSKIEAEKFELHEQNVRIDKTVDTVLRFVSAKADEAGLTLFAEVPPALPMIVADERALRQILINLLSNAIKFTPEGGRVTLEAECDHRGCLVLSVDRKSTRLNSSHSQQSRMPSSA